MPSTMVRNSPQEGLLRSAANQALDLWLPPEDPDGICTAQSVAVGTLNIDGAAVKSLVTNGKCVLVRPACPVFTFSTSADACTIEMKGTNQWGESVTWNIIRTAGSSLVTKVLPGSGRIPPMWTIEYIKITAVTAGAGTVSVGFNYTVGNSQSIALPISLGSTDDLQGTSSLVRAIMVEELDGFWTAGPWPAFPVVTSGNSEDIKRGVLAVTLGTTTANSTAARLTNANFTAATWTVGTLTLTKTGAFTGYEFRAGDTITAVSGTGFSAGTYAIASKVDSDNITLATSPGAGGAADAVFRVNDGTTAGLFLFRTSAFSGLSDSTTTISITGGTGVRAGTYQIKERRSANLITLESDPGGTNPTDVTFTLSGGNTKWGKLRLVVGPEVISQK